MARLSPSVRLLALLPLLVTGVDLTRATVACGPAAQTCLEAAGRGWMGVAALVLVPLYAVAFALALTRVGPRLAGARAGFARRWLLGTGVMAAACLGQVALSGAALSGGLPGLLVLCVVAGAVLAAALQARGAVDGLRPRAPRAPAGARTVAVVARPPAAPAPPAPPAAVRGRAPPRPA